MARMMATKVSKHYLESISSQRRVLIRASRCESEAVANSLLLL